MPPWWLWTTTNRARPRSSDSNWRNRWLDISSSQKSFKTLGSTIKRTDWSCIPKQLPCSLSIRIICQSHFQRLVLIMFLHLETCSNVPAYGRLLSASGNPMQCQVPFVPQARRRICSVNSQLAYLDSRTHRFLSISSGTQLPFFLPVLTFSTRGGFVALSPISPQNMFLQAFSHSREEKEEEDDDDYRSPYHPYHHPHGHHLHLHHLVKNLDIPG